jgi:hypothetical protein
MPQRVRSFVPGVLAGLVAASALSILPSSIAPAADECIAAPNSPTPEGSHWYYHVDRATGRKCWRVGPIGLKVTRPAAKPIAQPAAIPQPSPMARPLFEPRTVDTPTAIAPTERPATAPALEPTQQMQGGDAGSTPAVRWPDPPQPAATAREGETQTRAQMNRQDEAQSKPPMLAASSNAALDQGSTVAPVQMIALLAGALALAGVAVRAVVKAAAGTRSAADQRVAPIFDHPVQPQHTADLDQAAYSEPNFGAEESLRRILRAWERRAA